MLRLSRKPPILRVEGEFQRIAINLGTANDLAASSFAAACCHELTDFLKALRLLTGLCEEVCNLGRHLGERDQGERYTALALVEDGATPALEQGSPACFVRGLLGILVRVLRQAAGGRDFLPDRDRPVDAQAEQTPRNRAGPGHPCRPEADRAAPCHQPGRARRGGQPRRRGRQDRQGETPSGQKADLLAGCQGPGRGEPLPPALPHPATQPADSATGNATNSAQPEGPTAAPSAATSSTQLSSSPASSPLALAELANGQVQDVSPPGGHEGLHQYVERVAVPHRHRRPSSRFRCRSRGLAEGLRGRRCRPHRGPGASSAAEPRSKRLRSISRRGGSLAYPRGRTSSAETQPGLPGLNQDLDARLHHFRGDSAVHCDGCLQVGLAGAKGVERIGIGVLGDQDDVQVRRATSRARSAAWGYEVVLAMRRLKHGEILNLRLQGPRPKPVSTDTTASSR